MGIEIVEVGPDRVVGPPCRWRTNTQPYGLLHGVAPSCSAETLGSWIGSALHAGRQGGIAVGGIEINATHHRSATQGTVTGVATPVHLGRSLATYEVVISDERGRRVCTSRITCMLRRSSPSTLQNPFHN